MLLKHLKHQFKFDSFRHIQREIIERTMAKEDVLALMPTGGGKSLTYQFFASLLQEQELVLVVSPLIALMQDQAQKANEFAIKSTFINSSLSLQQKQLRMSQIAEGHYQMLFIAPERFQKPEFWECLQSRKIRLFVVDEAHCVSLWGHDFRPDYTRLQEFRLKCGSPPVLALTATATPDVQRDIANQFDMRLPENLLAGGLERPNIALNFIECYGNDEKNKKLQELLQHNQGEPVIVYFSLIQTLEFCARFLSSQKMSFVKYHGDLPPNIRSRNQADFINGNSQIILATPAFGLGIDKADIRSVIHYEIPASIESYFQEVGRAGRDGKHASGYLLYWEDDLSIQMQFLAWAFPDRAFIEKVYELIEKKPGVVATEGFEYLREQMVYKNKKDFRVNAAVSILNRWGCLEYADTPFGFSAVRSPSEEDFRLEDQDSLKKEHQKKLLALLRFIQNEDICRLIQIYQYFGYTKKETCGVCDVCRR